MAKEEHVCLLRAENLSAWQAWRKENPGVLPDLSHADLDGLDLRRADLRGADLTQARLANTCIVNADFQEAILRGAIFNRALIKDTDFSRAHLEYARFDGTLFYKPIFKEAHLEKAQFIKANLRNADFSGAFLKGSNFTNSDLEETDFTDADLNAACLQGARLVGTILNGANLTDTMVYGCSAWGIKQSGAKGALLVTQNGRSPRITADNIEVAQYLYLLLDNSRISNALQALGKKVVLILGRFSDERKKVLDRIREELPNKNYVSVLFDFPRDEGHDLLESVGMLAQLSYFIIADFTDAKAVIEEVPYILSNRATIIKPIFLKGSGPEPEALRILQRDTTLVLDTFFYASEEDLLTSLRVKVIRPAANAAARLYKSKKNDTTDQSFYKRRSGWVMKILIVLTLFVSLHVGQTWACVSRAEGGRNEETLAAHICGSSPFTSSQEKILSVFVFKVGAVPTMRLLLTHSTYKVLSDSKFTEAWLGSLSSDLKLYDGGVQGNIDVCFVGKSEMLRGSTTGLKFSITTIFGGCPVE